MSLMSDFLSSVFPSNYSLQYESRNWLNKNTMHISITFQLQLINPSSVTLTDSDLTSQR